MRNLGVVASAVNLAAAPTTLNAWTGADPSMVADPTAYELATMFQINAALTIVGGRIWNPGSQSRSGRTIKLWNTTGAFLTGTLNQELAISNVLPAGWSVYSFATPVVVSSFPAYYAVSYDTGAGSPDYGAISHALDAAITTADGKVTMPMSGGHFGTADTFVDSSFNNAFYGVDLRYQ